jgi:subtilisin family serine protease
MVFRRSVRSPGVSRPRRQKKLAVEVLEDRRLMAVDTLSINSQLYDGDSFLVQFRSTTQASALTSVGATYAQGTIARQLTGDGWYTVTVASSAQLAATMQAFQQRSDVLTVTPDFQLSATATTNDTSYASQWALSNRGQSGGVVGADIRVEQAWDYGTSTSTIVAVIDSGIDYSHPDLASNIWRNSSEIPNNGVDDDRNGYIDDVRGWDFANNDADPMDDNGHGTHVAGTIGAVGNNSVGVAGVAWRVQLMPLKFLSANGSGSLSDAIEAINYARTKGAKIINASWGGGGFSSALQSAITQFQNAGGIFVAAAGNENSNNALTPAYPANYSGVISVGASTRLDGLASFSNFGSNVTLVAPGSSILSTLPNNRYGTLSGTSMAAPHVAGALALLWGQNPSLTATALRQAVLNNTDNVLRGASSIYGRLNVGKAAAALKNGTAPNPTPTPTPTPTRQVFGTTQSYFLADATNRGSRTTTVPINVTGNFLVQDLNVRLNVSHTYLSDLTIRLIGPDGTAVNLVQRRGGSGDSLQVLIDDQATSSITTIPTSSLTSGTYRGEQGLATFQGKSAQGRWTLQITDNARADVGYLTSAQLEFSPTSGTQQTANATRSATASKPTSQTWLAAVMQLFDEWNSRRNKG